MWSHLNRFPYGDQLHAAWISGEGCLRRAPGSSAGADRDREDRRDPGLAVAAVLWARSRPHPARLIYALPQRSLVEQVAGEAWRWLENLGVTNQVALHVVMGGAGESQREWRLDMHKPAGWGAFTRVGLVVRGC
jgi:hypothetical protein